MVSMDNLDDMSKAELIRELKNAKQKIRDLENKLNDELHINNILMKYIPDHVFIKDKEHKFIRVNDAVAKDHGFTSAKELVGKSDYDLHSRDLANQFYEQEETIFHNNQSLINHEQYIFTSDKKKKWLSSTKIILKNNDGEIIGLVGINRDITDRKQAENDLIRDRNLLRTVIDNIPDYIFVVDKEGRYILSNRSHDELIGKNYKEHIINSTPSDFFDPAIAERIQTDDMQIIHNAKGYRDSKRLVRSKSGIKIPILLSKIPILDTNQEVAGLVGIGRDITKLEDERYLLYTILDHARDFIYLKDRSCKFVIANNALAELVGEENPKKLRGKTDYYYFSDSLASEFYNDDQSVITEGAEIIGKIERSISKAEQHMWVSTTKIPWRNKNGDILGLIGIGRDITDINNHHNLTQTLMDNLPYYIWYKDKDLKFVAANRVQLDRVRVANMDEIRGKTDYEISPKELADKYRADDLTVLETRQGLKNIEELAVSRDKKKIWISTTKIPILAENNSVVGILGIAQDVSERKQAYEEAQARVKQLETIFDISSEIIAELHQEPLLRLIIAQAVKLLTGVSGGIFQYDSATDQLKIVAKFNTHEELQETVKVGEGVVGRLAETFPHGEPYAIISNYKDAPYRVKLNEDLIGSLIAVRFERQGRLLGVIFVTDTLGRVFDTSDANVLSMYARLASIAFVNSDVHAQVLSQTQSLLTIYKACQEVSRSLTLQDTLSLIYRHIPGTLGRKAYDDDFYCAVVLLEGNALVPYANSLESVVVLPVNLEETNTKIGIVGRVIRSKKSQRVGNVLTNKDYIERRASTKSQMSIPLIIDGEPMGAITFEHPDYDAFTGEDEANMRIFAALAAVAIENSILFEARTELALECMGTSIQRHSIITNTQVAKNAIEAINEITNELHKDTRLMKSLQQCKESLSEIGIAVQMVLDRPKFEDASLIDIDEWAKEQEQKYGSSAGFIFDIQNELYGSTYCQFNKHWIAEVLEILISNSVRAMEFALEKKITLTLKREGRQLEIRVNDTGIGIHSQIRSHLFRRSIQNTPGSGMGLLLAQLIVKAYHGKISCQESEKGNTTFVIQFPFAEYA